MPVFSDMPESESPLNLVGMTREELLAAIMEIGEKPFRAKQLWHWIYNRGATDFTVMSNLSRSLQQKLQEHFVLARPHVSQVQTSKDGTRKWLLRFGEKDEAETVYIPDEERGTLCLSSQVGCTLTCKFCHTGTQMLVRNLRTDEIVGQMMTARDSYGEWPTPDDGNRVISNVVLMGMGEPLFNFDNVAKAVKVIMDNEGISLSKRRITLSTSGVVPMIRRCGTELGVNLAISLHAVHNDLRDRLMPINKKYPLAELMAALRDYASIQKRRITIEYVMLKGINDTLTDVKELVRLVRGLPVKFNLIPFNKWPGSEFECSEPEQIRRFSNYLFDIGYSAPIRQPRGQDILAACGQLKSVSERVTRATIRAARGDEIPPTPLFQRGK